MRLRSVAGALLAFALASATAIAQTETARITGLVTDTQGGVVPGATVTATGVDTGVLRTTVTDAEGKYVITNIIRGRYDLKVQLSGFKPVSARVQIPVGGAVTFDAKLEVGAVAEAVNVTAAPPELVNLANSEVSTVIRAEQIRDLPTLTRNVYDFVGLAGNVAPENSTEPGTISGDLAGVRRGTSYNINGTRASSTNILLDGSANNNEFTTVVGQDVPLDSVQEFSVVTNNFSAQYGRASGGIVNVVTKSGTNEFRGSVYEFFRSEKLASNTPDNVANNIPKGKFKRNQPGYSLGGPVVKDKLQFFSSLEYIRVRSADTELSWIPTPEFLALTSPATQAFFNAYGKGANINGPKLTRAQVAGSVGTGAGAFNALPADLPVFGQVQKSLPIDAGGGDPQDQYRFVSRVDWNIGPSTQSYVRYAYQKQDAQPGTNASSPYSGYDTGYLNHNHNILGSVTHVFSSSFTSQSKIVWNRLLEDQPLNGPSQPTLYMNPGQPVRLQGYRIAFPGYLPWSPGNSIPFGGPQQLLQLYQDQTWLKGGHDIRFGGSYVHINDDRTFGAYGNSVESLNTSATALTSLNNLVTGNLLRFNAAINPGGLPGGTFTTPVPFPNFTSHNRYNEFALYVQDNWRFGNRLSVNLGVRYEYFGPQLKSSPKYDSNFYYADPNVSVNSSSPRQIIDAVRAGEILRSNESPTGTLWKSDRNNFGPRVGFAWDATGDGRTSVRGGYGIGYERNFGNVTFNVLFNPPDYLVTQIEAPSDVASLPIFADNAGPFGGVAGVTKTIPIATVRHIDQNIVTAYAHHYGASIQREISRGIAASVEYNGSSGRDLYDLSDINRRGAALIYEGVGTALSRPNPLYGAFNTRGNRGRSQYHGVTFSVDAREIGRTGLAVTSKYTLSQTKDNLSTTFSSDSLNSNPTGSTGYLDVFNPMLDYGYSSFDVRHRLILSALWNVPFFDGGTGLRRTLLGGWFVNWIFNARTGFPFTVYDCSNAGAAGTVCMRAIDTGNINRNANSDNPTGNPNEYLLLDLGPIVSGAGSYTNPVTGDANWGPFPASMTSRNAFRGPGFWNLDFSVGKRFRIGSRAAAQVRLETFDLLNHGNMYVHTDNTDISSTTMITGYKDNNRRAQLGFKLEF